MNWNDAELYKCIAEMGVESIKKTNFRKGIAVGVILTVAVSCLYEQLKPAKIKPVVTDVENG